MIEAAKLGVVVSTDGVGKTSNELKGLGSTIQDLSKTAMKVGGGLSLGVTTPLAFMGKQAIEEAGNIVESMNKVSVVFEESAVDVTNFAATSAKAWGISKNDALAYAGTLGNMFDAMGLASEASADMSIDILKLASDMGSFHNVDPTDMLYKIKAGLVGESEPLRSVGVLINDLTMKTKAAELGFGKNGEALTENQKVLARYAIIVDQSKNAVGDFAKTSADLANSTRIQEATFKDLMGTLGTQLLPLKLQLVQIVQRVIEMFTNLSPSIQKGVVIFLGLAAAVGPILLMMGSLVPVIGTLISPIGLLIAGVAALAAAFAFNFGGIRDKVVGAITPVIDVLKNLVSYFSFIVGEGDYLNDFLANLPEPIQAVVGRIGELFASVLDAGRNAIAMFTGLRDAGQGIFDALSNSVTTFLGQLIGFDVAFAKVRGIREAIEPIQEAFDKVRDAVSKAVSVFEDLRGSGEPLLESLTGAVTAFIGSFVGVEKASEFIQGIIDAWNQLVEFFEPTIERLRESFGQMIESFEPIGGKLAELWKVAGPVLSEIAKIVGIVVVGAFNLLLEVVAAVMPSVGGIIGNAIDAATALFQFIGTTIQTVVGMIKSIMEGDWAAVWEGAKTIFGSFVETLSTLLGLIWDSFSTLFSNLVQAVGNWIGNIDTEAGQRFQSFVDGVREKFVDVYEKVKTGINSAVDYIRNIDLAAIGRNLITSLANAIANRASTYLREKLQSIADLIPQWIKDRLGIHSPSRVFYEIGLNIIQGLVEGMEHRTPEALEAMGNVLSSISSILEGMFKLGSATIVANGWADKLRGLTSQMQELYVIFNEFAAWSFNNGNVMEALADVGSQMSSVTSGIISTIEAMTTLGNWKAIEDVPGKLRSLIEAIRLTIIELSKFASQPGIEEAASISAPLVITAQAIADIAVAWEKVNQFTSSKIDATVVTRWLAEFANLAVDALVWAQTWVKTLPEKFSETLTGIRLSVSFIGDIAKAWETIRNFKWGTEPIYPIIEWLATLGSMATQIAVAASKWAAQGGESLENFAKTVDTSIGVLVDVAKAWEVIQEFKWSNMLVAPVIEWLATFAAMATQLVKAVVGWASVGGEALVKFGETVRVSLDALVGAARAWEVIQNFKWSNMVVEPVIKWLATLSAMATQFVEWARLWGSSNSGIKPFSEAIQASFGALNSALVFLDNLRAWKLVPGLEELFLKFRRSWEYIIEEFAKTRRAVGAMVTDDLRRFASALGEIADGLNKAISLFQLDLDSLQIPPETFWGDFFMWINAIFIQFRMFIQRHPELQPDSSLVDEFSNVISNVMEGLRSAIEVALMIPKSWTTPPDGVILPVIDWVMNTFNLFEQRLHDWFPDTPTEAESWPIVEQFAGAVGAVLSAIRDAALIAFELPRSWATPPDSIILPVIDWMMHAFRLFSGRLGDWFPNTQEEAKDWPVVQQFAEAAGTVLSAIRDAALLAFELPSNWATPPDSIILPIIDWMMYTFQLFARRLSEWFPNVTEEAKKWPVVVQFAEGVGVVLSAIHDAALFAMELPKEWATPPDSIILPVIDWMMYTFQLFARRLSEWFPNVTEEAKKWPVVVQFADGVGSVLNAIREAALLALELPNGWATPPDSIVLPVIDWMMHAFRLFEQRLVAFFPETAEEAKLWPVVVQFANSVGVVLGSIRSAALLALELPKTWTEPSDDIVKPVIDWMIHVFDLFEKRLIEVFPNTAEEAKTWPVVQQFSSAVGSVLGAIKDAALLSLQLPKTWEAPSNDIVQPVIDWMIETFKLFGQRLVAVFPNTAEEAKSWPVVQQFAQSVGSVLNAIRDAALLSLELPKEWTAPSNDIVQPIIDWMIETFKLFGQRLVAVFPNTAEEAKSWPIVQQFAQAVGVVMGAIKSAVDIAATVPDSWTAQDQTFLDNVVEFISRVFGKFYDWINSKNAYAGKPIPFGSDGLNLVQTFGGALQSLMGGLGASFEVFSGLLSFIPPSEARITSFIETVKLAINTANTKIVSTITPAATQAIQTFGSALQSLVGGLSASLNLFKDLAGTAPGTYTPGTVSAEFETRIGNLMEGISRTLTAFKTYVQDKVGSTWIPASNAFLNASQSVFNVLRQALDLFKDLSSSQLPSTAQLTAFVQAVLTVFSQLTTGLTQATPQISAAGTGVVNTFGNVLNGIPTQAIASSRASEVNKGLVAGLGLNLFGITGSSTVEGLSRLVSSTMFNIVKDNVPSLATTKGYGENTGLGLIQGMDSKLAGVIALATQLALGIFNSIKNNVTGFLTAKEYGGLIDQGLMDGMNAKASSVATTAYYLGRSIDEQLKLALGIHSPSKKSIEAGDMYAAGLVIGMTGKIGEVESAANALSNAMSFGNGNASQLVLAGVPTQSVTVNHRLTVTSPDGSISNVDMAKLADRLGPYIREGIVTRRY